MHDDPERRPVLQVRIPGPMLDAVDRATDATGQNRSEFFRECVTAALVARRLWPPTQNAADAA